MNDVEPTKEVQVYPAPAPIASPRPRRTRPNATPEQVAEIRRLRLEEKKSVAEVAKITGFSPGIVSTYANPHPFTAEEEDVAKRLEAGESQIAIVKTITGRRDRQGFVSQVFRRMVAEGRLKGATRTVATDPEPGSNRDRTLAFLREHSDETFTSRDIAKAMDLSITKVEFAVDSLRKMGEVEADKFGGHGAKGGKASSARAGASGASGDHSTWFNVRLKKAAPKSNGEATAPVRHDRELTDPAVREAILNLLAPDDAPLMDSVILRAALKDYGFGASVRYFDVNRLLANMERIGLVRFIREERGKRDALLTKIRITDAGMRSIGKLPRVPRVEAASGPVERIVATAVARVVESVAAAEPEPVVAAEPEPEPVAAAPEPKAEPVDLAEFPLLVALQRRIERASARAALLAQAVELTDDPKERDELSLYAAAAAPTLSDIEKEYLMYAATNGAK